MGWLFYGSARTTCATRLNLETSGCPQRPVGSHLCYKLGIATVVLLLPCISAYPAELAIPRNGSLMRAETPSCAVVCGMSWIRPWAPFNGAAIPMPYDGGLFDCDSGPTPHPSDATRQAAVRGSTESRVVSARAPSTPRVETTARRARLDDLN